MQGRLGDKARPALVARALRVASYTETIFMHRTEPGISKWNFWKEPLLFNPVMMTFVAYTVKLGNSVNYIFYSYLRKRYNGRSKTGRSHRQETGKD